MKKVILSIVIIAAAITSQAQDVKFGVRAGLNLSNMKAKYDGGSESGDTKLGVHFGGIAEIGLTETFAVQPELLFSTVGAKTGDYKTNLSYISVPVLAKYKVSGVGIYLGPQIGFLMSAKAKADGESADIKDGYKSIDFSGVLGVDYTLESGLGFGARYAAGLSNIAKKEDGEDGSLKNNGFQISVHYFFGGGK